jgi:hypothetical protein
LRLRLALVMAGLGSLALPVWLFTSYGGFGAGVVVGAVVGMAAWVWDQPPPFVEKWRLGRDGERETSKQLRKLRGEGWFARHDLDDRYGNLDHLVVGPGGVFLLDSKNLWGTFAVEDGVLACHHESLPLSDYSLPKLPRSLAAAARALERRLKDELGWIVHVHPVVVIWAAFPEQEAWLGHVAVVQGAQLVDWLRARPPRVAEADQLAIQAIVAALPAAS